MLTTLEALIDVKLGLNVVVRSSGLFELAWCLELACWSETRAINKHGGWNRGGIGLWGL